MLSKVSIIIPCYNGRNYLAECLDSAVKQGYPCLDIVVIDDGSTDGSHDVIRNFPQVSYHKQPNAGVATARNKGISLSNGEFIILLDQDDTLHPEAIVRHLRAFSSRPHIDMVYGSASVIDSRSSVSSHNNLQPAEVTYDDVLFGTVPAPCQCMFRRASLTTDGGLRSYSHGGDDFDLYLRLARRGPIYCHGEDVAQYRYHADQVSRRPSKVYRVIMHILLQHEGADSDLIDRRVFGEAKRHWKLYFGQFMPSEAIRYLLSGRISDFGLATRAFLSALPFSLFGFLRFTIKRLSTR